MRSATCPWPQKSQAITQARGHTPRTMPGTPIDIVQQIQRGAATSHAGDSSDQSCAASSTDQAAPPRVNTRRDVPAPGTSSSRRRGGRGWAPHSTVHDRDMEHDGGLVVTHGAHTDDRTPARPTGVLWPQHGLQRLRPRPDRPSDTGQRQHATRDLRSGRSAQPATALAQLGVGSAGSATAWWAGGAGAGPRCADGVAVWQPPAMVSARALAVSMPRPGSSGPRCRKGCRSSWQRPHRLGLGLLDRRHNPRRTGQARARTGPCGAVRGGHGAGRDGRSRVDTQAVQQRPRPRRADTRPTSGWTAGQRVQVRARSRSHAAAVAVSGPGAGRHVLGAGPSCRDLPARTATPGGRGGLCGGV